MEGDSPSPLWAQYHPRRRSSPPVLNPVLLILLIPTLFLLLLFFLLPPFLSYTSQFLPVGSVVKSWDSFNVLLLVCAILCGVFARRNEGGGGGGGGGGSAGADSQGNGEGLNLNSGKSQTSGSGQWFVQDRQPATGGRLRRSSSSYPDLRHVPVWETDESRFRFFDDFELNQYRAPPSPASLRRLPERRTSGDRGDFMVREIPVDTFVSNAASATRPPSPPHPESPEKASPVQRRTFQSIPSEEEEVERDQFQFQIQTTASDQPRPPPVTAEAVANRTQERKLNRGDRKKSGSAKEIATAIATSIYSQRKRKRKTRTRNIYESASPLFQQTEEQSAPPRQTAAPPPPPPPPPPPSFFQNIFKKGGKTKRVHSVSVSTPPGPPPPPPPPRSLFNSLLKTGSKSKRFQPASTSPSGPPPPPTPPPSSIFNNIFKSNTKSKRFHSISIPPPTPPPPPPSSTFRNMFRTGSKHKRFDHISRYPHSSDQIDSQPQSPRLHTPPASDSPRRRNTTPGRPPLPTKMNQHYNANENINSGGQSPLIQIPRPPPLPPFKIPEMNFVARGDFVRIRSAHSSRCSSPGLDDIEFLPSRSSDATEGGGDIPNSVTTTCPSPDVDLKADTFIARLRGEWRIELMNSVKERRRKMSQQQP